MAAQIELFELGKTSQTQVIGTEKNIAGLYGDDSRLAYAVAGIYSDGAALYLPTIHGKPNLKLKLGDERKVIYKLTEQRDPELSVLFFPSENGPVVGEIKVDKSDRRIRFLYVPGLESGFLPVRLGRNKRECLRDFQKGSRVMRIIGPIPYIYQQGNDGQMITIETIRPQETDLLQLRLQSHAFGCYLQGKKPEENDLLVFHSQDGLSPREAMDMAGKVVNGDRPALRKFAKRRVKTWQLEL